MRCKKAKILLSAYIDRELDKRETESVKAHLEKCSRCREKLSELEEYKRLTTIIEKKTAPAGFTETVWHSLGKETQNKRAKKTQAYPQGRILFWAAAATIAILIAVTLIPLEIFYPDVIETNYYTETEKGGKGPPKEIRNNEKGGKGGKNDRGEKNDHLSPEETTVRNLLNKHGGKLNSITYIENTIKPSRIELTIPAANFGEFRKEYNIEQNNNPIPEVKIRKADKAIPLVINFPSRSFLAGDFNADGFDDIMVYSQEGKNSARFVLAPNDSIGNFNSPIEIETGNTGLNSMIEGKTLSGDFNRDGFDDILIFEHRSQILSLRVLKNIKGRKLRRSGNVELSIPDLKNQDRLFLFSGDINGDSLDDLMIHHNQEGVKGAWWLSENLGNYKFDEPILIETGNDGWKDNASYLPFLCDINGDGLFETGMYGKGGARDARWYTSLNKGNNKFTSEQLMHFGSSGMAFQGDYYPLFGDFNGDGLTDILVKYGSPEVFSNWYMIINLSGYKFSLGKDVGFNGKKDFVY